MVLRRNVSRIPIGGKLMLIPEKGPYIIAEIGNNHQGSMQIALDLIEKAAECGVNAVKFQKRDNKSLYTSKMYNSPYNGINSFGKTYGEHRERLEFGIEDYTELSITARQLKLDFIVTPFDVPSLKFLVEGEYCNAYKVGSGSVTDLPLLREIAKTGKPVFLSTGACTSHEMEEAIEILGKGELIILHCVSQYPADYNKLNFALIVKYLGLYPSHEIGYSGHEVGIMAPVVAHVLGARVIEKHFTFDRSWRGSDHAFSLEPAGMGKMVKYLKQVGPMMGSGIKVFNQYEENARVKMGKSLYYTSDLYTGYTLNESNIIIQSPWNSEGFEPKLISSVVGKVLRRDVKKDDLVLPEDVWW